VHDTVALAMWMSGMPGVWVRVWVRARTHTHTLSLSLSVSLSLSMRMFISRSVYVLAILKTVKCECTWTNACVRACVRACVHMCESTRRCAFPEGCSEKGVYICYVANGRGRGDLVKYCKHHHITSSHAAAFTAPASSVSMACQHPQVFSLYFFFSCASPRSLARSLARGLNVKRGDIGR